MLIVKVKICGITNYEDAAAAAECGADLLGFNFYAKSPRYIKPEAAVKIIAKMSASVDLVGVFVNETFDRIRQVMDMCQFGWIQLHGDETPKFCDMFRTLNVKTIKAIRVKEKSDIAKADDYCTDAVLLDAFSPEKYGGTGIRTFDWNVVGHITKRVFLAGGINAENAAEAVSKGVYGIDVCSGIESAPGKKDHKQMKQLFENISHFRA
ncbi:MAG: phosphoribosylanthranilate isomerase [Phycisphaerae bacterium]|nr:phosphoribosylanthranilate isomerase [Phycisphaerae bacterium]